MRIKKRSSFYLSLLLCAAACFSDSARVYATIDVSLQMQLGNPSNAAADTNNHNHYLIQRTVEAIDYSDYLGEPNWASWDYTTNDSGSSGRSGSFFQDTTLPPNFTNSITPADYPGAGSGYDRGHMCPSGDRTDNTTDNDLVFYMSNIIPQASDNNQGLWGTFESYCRTQAGTGAGNEILIICGPGGFTTNRFANGKVAMPATVWKVAVIVTNGSGTALSRITTATRVIAIETPNTNGLSTAWQDFITSAGQIERDTGLTFFTALPPTVASALRSKVDGLVEPAPAITSFTPGSGGFYTNVVITGNNFDSTTVVSFNGAAAVFSVDSTTQITATVPTNATTGHISVTTPAGTATSAANFSVVSGGSPDLAIYLSHSGSFIQGDSADTCVISVANVGTVASAGAITVTNALPAGLTVSGITGAGWTLNTNTLTFTRSDSLAPGSGFSPITLTVSVAANASSPVTNLAGLTGGGDASSANNTAQDIIVINPSAPPGVTVLVGWDTSALAGGSGNFGPSPFSPTTNAPNLIISGWTRGAGVGQSGTGAAHGWGGTGFTNSSSANAIGSNQFVSFGVAAANGYRVSYSTITKFDYRRSSTGAANGLLQYKLGAGSYLDIATFSYPSNTSAGGSITPIDLSGIGALQNVGAGTNVTFRVVNWGGTSSGGTWYIFDVASSAAADFTVQGTVSAAPPVLTPIEAWRQQYFGVTNNAGAAADTAVASSDGMPNLLKYALGYNPLIPTNNPVVGDVSTGFLRLTLPKNPNATDISFQVEVSTDLTTNSWSAAGTTIDQNTSTLLQVHYNIPVATSTQAFMRLRITDP
jgi:DNA/RNA endonuclease G (NUC1)